jgi:phospholipid/cholesterol/gamma-HCH transport system permease protein
VAANRGFGVGWDSFSGTHLVEYGDVTIAVTKTLAYGVAVPLVSSHAGLSASGGAPGVGDATTRSVIGSCLTVLFLDLIVGAVGYVVFW